MGGNKDGYLDENLSEHEKESGRTRLPMPEEEGRGEGKRAEQPYPGREDRSSSDYERPDEFGDGDRRS
ncbi:MAG TPA: hypothetical protein VEB19_01670 [Gemmatimonadaceae bacterium]|nr:hypothetical protein [Gemmatimonadaceae bacterium]